MCAGDLQEGADPARLPTSKRPHTPRLSVVGGHLQKSVLRRPQFGKHHLDQFSILQLFQPRNIYFKVTKSGIFIVQFKFLTGVIYIYMGHNGLNKYETLQKNKLKPEPQAGYGGTAG